MTTLNETSKNMIGVTTTAKQDNVKQLKTDVIYVYKQPRDAQARYKQHFDARLLRTNDKVSLEIFVYVEITLADQPQKLPPDANGSFPAVSVDPQTVTTRRPNHFVENVSRKRPVKATTPCPGPISRLCALLAIILIFLEQSARQYSHAFAPHGFTLMKRYTGGASAKSVY